jgi:putative aldouronate transport system substrate-binding protein
MSTCTTRSRSAAFRNSESVKTEVVKAQPKFDEYNAIALAGVDSKWRVRSVIWNKELRSPGLDTIRVELLKQVHAYLNANGK